MALLNEKIRKEVRTALADVSQPVTFKVFTQPFECQYCKENVRVGGGGCCALR